MIGEYSRDAAALVWSKESTYEGTQSITMPVLSKAEAEEIRSRWIDTYGTEEQQAEFFLKGNRVEVTHPAEVLTGDSTNMVERAKAAARADR